MAIVTDKPSPMGWFYQVDGGEQPSVYRCKIGQAWERAEVYDIAAMTGDELRFVADLIDRHKAHVEDGRP